MPPAPASTESHSYTQSFTSINAASSASGRDQSSDKELVKKLSNRDLNLESINIQMRSRRKQFPEDIKRLVDQVHNPPGPSPDEVWQDQDLEDLESGAAKGSVQRYF